MRATVDSYPSPLSDGRRGAWPPKNAMSARDESSKVRHTGREVVLLAAVAVQALPADF
ncbi:MAG: hypothetical protein K0R57_54 [Paenibacillaceae bacterium]|jgi:hypothetical protein|nr:hypothetical protein [Paenibacillaceae bacterium]